MTSLINPNLTAEGYSETNMLKAGLIMGCDMALIRDSPKLVTLCNAAGMTTIYRAAGDGHFNLGTAEFVQVRLKAAPGCDFVHLTNEVGLPPELDAWTKAAALEAERWGKHVVAYNVQTNQSVGTYAPHKAMMQWLTERGHAVGVHLYLDGEHDDGGYAPLDWLHLNGIKVFITEYGYIHSIFDANTGWRADMDAPAYNAWLDVDAPRLASYQFPAFLFAIDQWPNSEEGKRKGFGTEDHVIIQRHAAEINALYPIQETPIVATDYDLLPYLCPPNGNPLLLSSGENCRSVLCADQWIEFRKNRLVEEFYYDDHVIGRGADTSMLWTSDEQYRGRFYVQYQKDARGRLVYGAPWAKRRMSVGETFRRVCTIVYRDWQCNLISQDNDVVTTLVLRAHHDSKYFSKTGITVQDVLEFQWGGEERYYYGKGFGLIAWENLATGVGNYIVAFNATAFEPAQDCIERPAPPVTVPPEPPSPQPILPPTVIRGLYTLARMPSSFVNVRLQPDPTSADLGNLYVGDAVTLYAPDHNSWVYIEKAALRGWVSRQNGAVVFVEKTVPPVEAFSLTSPLPQGIITAHFNQPRDYDGDGMADDKHEGTDFALAPNPCAIGGVQVVASADGVVESVRSYAELSRLGSFNKGYGVYVKVRHVVGPDTYISWYCHLSAELVCKGQAVKRGDPLGILGTTGNSTGYHCHLNLQHLGHGLSGYVVADVVDPERYLVK